MKRLQKFDLFTSVAYLDNFINRDLRGDIHIGSFVYSIRRLGVSAPICN